MNCTNYQNEIETQTNENQLSAQAAAHFKKCSACEQFRLERRRLQQLLQTLPNINAPNDFNFRLKARLRSQADKSSAKWIWQKNIWLAPAAFAVVIGGFFAAGQILPPAAPPQNAAVINFQQTESSAQAVLSNEIRVDKPQSESANANLTVASAVPANEKSPQNTNLIRRAAAENRFVALSRRRPTRRDSEIRSRDSSSPTDSRDFSVRRNDPLRMPRGFSDPLDSPPKISASDLLKTFGVQTEANSGDELRVISVTADSQAARAGLQNNDVIQQVNGDAPLSLSGNSFKELNLKVQRQGKNREIKITLNDKP